MLGSFGQYTDKHDSALYDAGNTPNTFIRITSTEYAYYNANTENLYIVYRAPRGNGWKALSVKRGLMFYPGQRLGVSAFDADYKTLKAFARLNP